MNHERDFSSLQRLNKEHTTSLKAQNAAQNGSKKTPQKAQSFRCDFGTALSA
jgi:hypothetical protein